MGRWLTGLTLIVFFFVVVIVNAPARLLPALVPESRLQLQGLDGTLWQGRASRALLVSPAGPIQLGQLEWRLAPLSLLTLAPAVSLRSHWGDQNGSADVTLHGKNDISLRDVDLSIDAGLIQQLVPVAMEGRVTLTAPLLRLRDGLPIKAEGRLVWEQGAWNAPRARLALGSYALDFSQAGADDPLRGQVLTLAGPVNAEGQVELAARQYAVDMRIGSDSALDPVIAEALSLVARPEGEAFHLLLNGAL